MNLLPLWVESTMLEHFHNKDFLSPEEKAQFMKSYEDKIENSLRDLIKSIKKRMVLLIGDDYELLKNLGVYYYLIAGETPFYNYSLEGMSENELQVLFATADGFYTNKNIRKYGSLVNRLEENCSVFLLDLDCKDSPFLRRFTRIIRKIKEDWSFSSSPRGLLLIGTATPLADIPQRFKCLFEIVEPAQNTASRPQTPGKAKDILHFPTPPGTQWHEVKIRFVDDENVKISAREVIKIKHYSEMGFRDAKSGKAIFLWGFLKKLAYLSGRFTNCPDKEKVKVKENISDLRKKLKYYFKTIQGDPVPYKKKEGYETAFIIGTNSYDEYENEIRKHLKGYVKPKNEYSKQQVDCNSERLDDDSDDKEPNAYLND